MSVPVVPGCVSQRNTREEALGNIQEAIELYVERLAINGLTKLAPAFYFVAIWVSEDS